MTGEVQVGSRWRQRRSGVVVEVLRVYRGSSGPTVEYQSASASSQVGAVAWFVESYERVADDTPVTSGGPGGPGRPGRPARIKRALVNVLAAYDQYIEDDDLEPLAAAMGAAREALAVVSS